MIDIPTIDELRAARGRLAKQAGLDSQRYATLIQDLGPERASTYVSRPLCTLTPAVPSLPAIGRPEHEDSRQDNLLSALRRQLKCGAGRSNPTCRSPPLTPPTISATPGSSGWL